MQSALLEDLVDSRVLHEHETDVLRWAMNAKWTRPSRATLTGLQYKQASALEALVRIC